jgi:hypothetical protein
VPSAARLAIPDARRYAITRLHALPDSLVLLAKGLEPFPLEREPERSGRRRLTIPGGAADRYLDDIDPRDA